MRPDIRPGGIFPDYALPDHTGTVRTLSELQGRDPLILTLARGNYCPKGPPKIYFRDVGRVGRGAGSRE